MDFWIVTGIATLYAKYQRTEWVFVRSRQTIEWRSRRTAELPVAPCHRSTQQVFCQDSAGVISQGSEKKNYIYTILKWFQHL